MGIDKEIELTPHTLRRAFAIYHAEAGLPLPLLQKLLGHASIRTTALYWRNIYNDGGDDTSDILTGKIWLEKPKKLRPKPAEVPIKVDLELPELLVPNLSLSSPPLAEHLTKINQLEEQLNQARQENNNLKFELNNSQEQEETLQNDLDSLNQQNTLLHQAKVQEASEKNQLQQNLTQSQETINQLEKKLTTTESDLSLVKAFNKDLQNNLTQAKQINSNLYQQLQTEQAKNSLLQETNTNLNQQIANQEQNHANLLNTYQTAIKDKQTAETLIQSKKQNAFTQKQRADHYETQLKAIAKNLHQ